MRGVISGNDAIRSHFMAGSGARFIWSLLVALGAIWTNNPFLLIGLLLINMVLLLVWNASLIDLYKVFRYIIWLFFFLFVLHLFSHTGEILFSVAGLHATREGARAGVLYGLKLFVFSYSGLIIFKTVDPNELISPLERLARKLGHPGRPLSSIALTFFLALRFLPEFSRQAKTTMLAFKGRGIDLRGSLIHKARVVSFLAAPIFVNALKRSELATAALNIKGYTTRHLRAELDPARLSLGSGLLVLSAVAVAILGWYL